MAILSGLLSFATCLALAALVYLAIRASRPRPVIRSGRAALTDHTIPSVAALKISACPHRAQTTNTRGATC